MYRIVGFRSGSGLDSRDRGLFRFRSRVRVFRDDFITNWGLGLVPVYVEKLGSGFRKSGPSQVLKTQLHH